MSNEVFKARNQEPVDIGRVFNNETVTISLERYEEMKKRIKDAELDAVEWERNVGRLVNIIEKVGMPKDMFDRIIPESIVTYEKFCIDDPFRKRYRVDFDVDMKEYRNMTKYTIGERCSGKTTRLIERSAKEGIYILVPTKDIARCIADQAKEMGLDIPFPVTVGEYLNCGRHDWSNIREKGLLIDELDLVLERLLRGIPVHEVTLTDRGNVERLDSLANSDNKYKGSVVLPLDDYTELLDQIREIKEGNKVIQDRCRELINILAKLGITPSILDKIDPDTIDGLITTDVLHPNRKKYRIEFEAGELGRE